MSLTLIYLSFIYSLTIIIVNNIDYTLFINKDWLIDNIYCYYFILISI